MERVSTDFMLLCLGKSTDPRDKVFALLAMTPEEIIAPDYRQSTRKVFLSVARSIMLHHQSLDVLCHYEGTPSQYNLPSWAPDWTLNRVSKTLAPPQVSENYYMADGWRPASIAFKDDQRTLVTKGVILDTVRQVGAVYDEANSPSVNLREWQTIAISESDVSTTEAVFMETLIAYPAYKGSKPSPFERFYGAWHTMILDEIAPESENASETNLFQKLVY